MKSSVQNMSSTPYKMYVLSLLGIRQKGVASAVSVFLVLVLVSGMVLATMIMVSSSIMGSNQQSDYIEALFLAESAIERAALELNNDANLCGALSSDPVIGDIQAFGNGEFQIMSDVGDSLNCSLQVRGQKGDIIRFIDVDMTNAGGAGLGVLLDHFPNLSGWTWNPTDNQGVVSYDGSENCTICSGTPSGGSVRAETNSGGSWRRLRGYQEKDLGSPIDTTGGGVLLDWSVGWKKDIIGTLLPTQHIVSIEIYSSTAVAGQEIWQDIQKIDNGAWTEASGLGFALTDGRIYDKVRVHIDLRGRNDRIPIVWIDELNLIEANGAAVGWVVNAWREVAN